MKRQNGMDELIKTNNGQLFWSVEYTDKEGELNIKHIIATPAEMSQMMDKFVENGISAKAYMINPTTE
jgi:hypothetical protein